MNFKVLGIFAIIWLGLIVCDEMIFVRYDSTEMAKFKHLGTLRELYFVPATFEFNIGDLMNTIAEIRKKFLEILEMDACKDRPTCEKYCQNEFEDVSNTAEMIAEFNKDTRIVQYQGRRGKREIVTLIAVGALVFSTIALVSRAETKDGVNKAIEAFSNKTDIYDKLFDLHNQYLEELFEITANLSRRIDKIENRNAVDDTLLLMKNEMDKIRKKLIGLYAMMTTKQISMDHFAMQQLREMMSRVSGEHKLFSENLNDLVATAEVHVKFEALKIQLIVKVPCAKADEFKLFEIIPYPIVTGNKIKTLSLNFKYVARKKSKFATTLHGLDSCIITPGNYFCKLEQEIVFLEKSNIEASCELHLYELEQVSDKCNFVQTSLHSNKLIEPETNEFIYLVMSNTSIKYGCGTNKLEKANLTSHTSFGLPCNCFVQLNDFTLTPKDCDEGKFTFVTNKSSTSFNIEIGSKKIQPFTKRTLYGERKLVEEAREIKLEKIDESWWDLSLSEKWKDVCDWFSNKKNAFLVTIGALVVLIIVVCSILKCLLCRR